MDLSYSDVIDTILRELVFSAPGLKEIPDPKMVLQCKEITVGKKRLTTDMRSNPKASFTLSMSMPSVGQDLPVTMNVKQESDTSVPSTVFLKSIKVSLEERIGVQSTHSNKSSWTNPMLLACGVYLGEPIPITDGMDIGKMPKLRIPPDLYPTFETRFIRRDYTLAIKIAVECIGETSRVDFVQSLQLLTMGPGPWLVAIKHESP